LATRRRRTEARYSHTPRSCTLRTREQNKKKRNENKIRIFTPHGNTHMGTRKSPSLPPSLPPCCRNTDTHRPCCRNTDTHRNTNALPTRYQRDTNAHPHPHTVTYIHNLYLYIQTDTNTDTQTYMYIYLQVDYIQPCILLLTCTHMYPPPHMYIYLQVDYIQPPTQPHQRLFHPPTHTLTAHPQIPGRGLGSCQVRFLRLAPFALSTACLHVRRRIHVLGGYMY
jgi:hypothetical protein